MVFKVGIVSDTHGRLDPRALSIFEREQVGAILHAGDIGGPNILWELNAIAPVTAVLGNNDIGGVAGWALDPVARLTLGGGEGSEGCRIALVHVRAHLKPTPRDINVVVSGHTHVPSATVDPLSGALCVNPGSVSRPRAGTEPTVGVLEIVSGPDPVEVSFRVISLTNQEF